MKSLNLLVRVVALLLFTYGTFGVGLIYLLATDKVNDFLDIEYHY